MFTTFTVRPEFIIYFTYLHYIFAIKITDVSLDKMFLSYIILFTMQYIIITIVVNFILYYTLIVFCLGDAGQSIQDKSVRTHTADMAGLLRRA